MDAQSKTIETLEESRIEGRPLRVLLLTDCFPKPTLPNLGVWALVQAQALVAAGAKVRVVSPTSWIPPLLRSSASAKRFSDCPRVHDYSGVTVHYPRWMFYAAGPVRKLWYGHPFTACKFAWWTLRGNISQEIAEFRPDVLFAHHTIPGGMMAVRIKEKFAIPYIVEDFDFGSIESCFRMPLRRKAFERVARSCYAMAGASSRIAEGVKRLVPGIRAVPLYMGMKALAATVFQTPRPARLDGKLVVFSAASFYERKGIPLLIEAFAKVSQKHPNAILRLAGDGHERPSVDAALAKAALGDRIQLFGIIPHDQVLQEMVWCDLFMLVGWEEPFATVYIEAMAAGKPIICCNDGGICDVMQDRVEGLTVPPKDVEAAAVALDELLSNADLRNALGRGGHQLFEEKLDDRATARETLKLLKGAIVGV